VKIVTRSRDDDTGKATIEITALNAGSKARVHYTTDETVSTTSPLIPDQIFETEATVLWFLAVDELGKHHTGPAEKWSNMLTLTHEPKEVMGKRSVTLDVKPRGQIRWNIDGTNPREGKPYTGPIEIPGNEEVVVYAYADDAGVSVQKNFTIRPSIGGKATIDPEKPATVRKRFTLATTVDTFTALRAAKKSKVRFGNGISIKVGKGDLSATTRFGPGITLSPDAAEGFITASHSALNDDAADVEVGFGEIACGSGRELEEFLHEVAELVPVEPTEVEQ